MTPYTDVCGDYWELYSSDTLEVRDCPIEVELSVDRDSICLGECNRILVEVSGGDLQTYHFDWDGGFPDNSGPIPVCPNQTTTYRVRVYDENGSPHGWDSVQVFLRENPQIPEDSIVCETLPPFVLESNSPGGFWQGTGITDPALGIFDPDSAGDGVHTIEYENVYGCKNQMKIQVNGIDAGRDEAACTGAPVFTLIEYEPKGGIWSGQHVSPNGLFNPSESGIFTLNYIVNGCVDQKEIYVGGIDLSTALPRDSVCESDPDFAMISIP